MQTWSTDENSVCLSVKRVHCDKTEERSVQIFIPYERLFSQVFWEAKWLVGVTTSTWNSGSTVPRWGEIANVEPTFTSSASAVTPSEKVQLTRQEVHYAVFNEPKIIVRCPNPTPKGGSKTQNGRFRCKIALRLKKVCYKVSFCEKWQRQSC